MTRLFHALVAGALLLFSAAPVMAQDSDELTLAEARAIADQVIASGEATGFFENASEEGFPAARHKRSGLVCLLAETPEGSSISIIDSPIRRGDDVACSLLLGDTTVTIYATRYQPAVSDDEVVAGSVEAIEQNWENVVPYEDGIPAPTLKDAPTMSGAAFFAEKNGRKVYTQLMVATVGDWSVKLRITGPSDAVEAVQSLGAGLFGYAIDHMRLKPGTD